MATVISSDRLENHSIDKYNFKVFSMGNQQVESASRETPESSEAVGKAKAVEEKKVEKSSISSSSKDSLVESLMQKTDEMSSNFIKLQMKLESMSDEHKLELQKVKDESFLEGVTSGKAEMLKLQEENISSEFIQLGNSISTLEVSASNYERALETIKDELVNAALDISKEVIGIELSENSSEVVQLLSEELIKDLQGASKITLRVNPKNYDEITNGVGSLSNIEIVSDSAVSEGGVIAMSDNGNIDAQIEKRFQKVKKAVLSE